MGKMKYWEKRNFIGILWLLLSMTQKSFDYVTERRKKVDLVTWKRTYADADAD